MSMTSNSSSVWGALYYNFNEVTGSMLGEPTVRDRMLYSDIVDPLFSIEFVNYLTGVPETDMSKGSPSVSVVSDTISPEEWLAGDWFLFGQTWLPWFAPINPPDQGDRYLIRRSVTREMMYNPLSMPILTPTLMSMAKVTGIGLGGYFGAKYGYEAVQRFRG